MNHQARIVSQRNSARAIYLITSNAALSVPQWAYVRVDRLKEQAFLRALQSAAFDCADYGEVLASGHDMVPPTHVVWQMESLATD